jgi:putative tricarboxylic transport membrane protein
MGGTLKLVLPHGVMLLASVLLYVAASRIDVDTGGRISPALWPKAVIVFMGLLCAYEIVKRLVASRLESARGLIDGLDRNPAQLAAAEEASALAPKPAWRMLFSGIALIAAYVIAVPWTGFILTTTVFLILFPMIGGFRRMGLAVAIGVAGGFVLAVTFLRIAYISLPLGEGPFRSLSLALMRALGVS